MTNDTINVSRGELDEIYDRICAMYGAGAKTARLLADILSRATPSPASVSYEDVERACKALFPETWSMQADNLKAKHRANCRRILESLPLAAKAPNGFVLVPVEPTDAMLEAFGAVEINDTYGTCDHLLGESEDAIVTGVRAWAAMLRAAPQPKEEGK